MKTAGDFAESLTRYWEFCLAFRSEVCAAIADRDAEHEAEKSALRAEVEAARARLGTAERLIGQCAHGTNAAPYCPGCGNVRETGDSSNHSSFCPLWNFLAPPPADSPAPAKSKPKCAGYEHGDYTDDPSVDPADFCDAYEAGERTYPCPAGYCATAPEPGPGDLTPQGESDPSNSFLAPVLARLDALELGAKEDAKAWAESMLKLDAKLAALERVVKRIDTEHAEMCPQHTGLATPPAPVAIPMLPPRRAHVYIDPEDEDEPEPVAEPPMCYQIDCRHYGQRHATAHEPREPEAAETVHAFVAGIGSVCWHYHPPKDGSAGLFCHAPPGNPIHATERK